jgi:hypothetical protein
LFVPHRFIEEENKDIATRNNYKGVSEQPHRAHRVRRAFFASLILVLFFAGIGYSGATIMAALGRCSTPSLVAWLQVVGACLLLWGTLFVRGWDIQTFSGVVFTERVNQWLYRALYCAGTAVLVYSLSFPLCAP